LVLHTQITYLKLILRAIGILICLNSLESYAQSVKIGFRVKADTIRVKEYEFTGLSIDQTYLQMSYGGHEIKNPKAYGIFKDKHITKIELVYTDHPAGVDLKLLNKQRLAALYLLAPEVFDDRSTHWNLVEQHGGSDQDVYSMFHGFAITYRDKSTGELIAEESKYIREVLEETRPLEDSTVFKIMDRNKEWKSMLVIGDLTGSMSPYSAQLLLWHKLNFKTDGVKYFVFFNDGDEKRDEQKKIGQTGGIYYVSAESLEKVMDVAFETMGKGTGGDTEENDLEALLFGLKQYTDFQEVVMVLDNKSDVRDMALLTKVSKPVKIVLCGTEDGVNPVYLQIARNSGGSVHTLEEDLYNLAKLIAGETIRIKGQLFKIEADGRFVELDRL